VWSGCGIVFVTVALVSCTQGQIQQAIGNTTQNMISGPCPSGMGLVSEAPEFCLYVTELSVTHDTEADVNLTIMNRTGRRVYLKIPSRPSLSDSSGTKWGHQSTTGIESFGAGGTPLPLDPNVNSNITIVFIQRGQAVSPDLTFSMSGEVMVLKADSRGEMMRQVAPIATRGFHFSGIRQGPQESVQKAATSSLQGTEQPSPLASPPTTEMRVAERGPTTTNALQPSTPPKLQSKNQDPAIGPRQNSLTKSTAVGHSRPTSSKASLDVLGIQVGMSTATDVRTALARVAPPLTIKEHQEQLRRQSKAGRAFAEWIDIENGKYLSAISGITQSYKDLTQCPNPSSYGQRGDCEQIFISFPAPPNASRALSVTRSIFFLAGPSFERVMKSLTEKYGEPVFRKVSGDNGVHHHYVWAWSADGAPVALNEQHACNVINQGGFGTSGISPAFHDNSQTTLQLGCAAVLHANIQLDNSVLKFMTLVANDEFNIASSAAKSAAYADEYVAAFEKTEREKAAKVSAPKF